MCLSLKIRTDGCADSEGDPHQTLSFTYQSRIEKLNNLIKHVESSQLSFFQMLKL